MSRHLTLLLLIFFVSWSPISLELKSKWRPRYDIILYLLWIPHSLSPPVPLHRHKVLLTFLKGSETKKDHTVASQYVTSVYVLSQTTAPLVINTSKHFFNLYFTYRLMPCNSNLKVSSSKIYNRQDELGCYWPGPLCCGPRTESIFISEINRS